MKDAWKMPEIKRRQIEVWVEHNPRQSKVFNYNDLTASPTVEETVMASFLYGPINQKHLYPLIFEIRLIVGMESTFDKLISQGRIIEVGKNKNGETLYGSPDRHREKENGLNK